MRAKLTRLGCIFDVSGGILSDTTTIRFAVLDIKLSKENIRGVTKSSHGNTKSTIYHVQSSIQLQISRH
jgi:hypothetical protein